MNRDDVIRYVEKTYGILPEYLWAKYPNYAVLRRIDNRKWFAALMDIPKNKVGLDGNDIVEILNVKCDPILLGSLLKKDGFYPAYHMNKSNWVSILLNDISIQEETFMFLNLSYELTANKKQ